MTGLERARKCNYKHVPVVQRQPPSLKKWLQMSMRKYEICPSAPEPARFWTVVAEHPLNTLGKNLKPEQESFNSRLIGRMHPSSIMVSEPEQGP